MRKYAAILFVLLMSIGLTIAQDNDVIETQFAGAYTITIPNTWTETQNSGNGYFWETEDSSIRIRLYDLQDQVQYDIPDVEALLDVLAVGVFGETEIDQSAIDEVEFGSYTGISYTYEENDGTTTFMRTIQAYRNDNDFIMGGYIRPISGYDLNQSDVDAMQAALSTIEPQDAYHMHEGTQFEIPDGWQLTRDYNGDFVISNLTNGEIALDISLWPGYGGMAGFEEPGGLLEFYFARDPQFEDFLPFDRTKIEPIEIAGMDGIIYKQNNNRLNSDGMYSRAIIELILPNNGVITSVISTAEEDTDYDAINDIFDTLETGTKIVCALFADPGIRIRTEATTNSEMVRQTDDETLIAVFQIVDSAGYTWFNVTEGYIRSDVIFYEQKACDPIPTR